MNPPGPARRFRIAMTGDFYNNGLLKFADIGHDLLAAQPHLDVSAFAEHRAELEPEQIQGVQGVIVLTPAVTARSLSETHELLAISRFGVGYDAVDVPACTAADVVVCITVGAVDRSVAEATVGWMLSLTHHMRTKDRLVRTGEWNERTRYMGCELRGRTLGVIGLGGIGRALVGLLAGFGMNPPLAFDPYLSPEAARQAGVTLVSLEELLQTADFVSIHCPLSEETRNLIGARELGRMKPTAYLLNTARGGIVNEAALEDVLRRRAIAGAALDCFVGEPITTPHRLGELDNVLLAPHSIAWTHEMFRDIGRMACQGLIDLSLGRKPRGVVNPEVFDRPSFQAKWARLRCPPP
jgi:phosphoglycerate dehydrogenase-like enzyme